MAAYYPAQSAQHRLEERPIILRTLVFLLTKGQHRVIF